MAHFIERVFNFLLDVVFPPKCINCRASIAEQKNFICEDCLSKIEINNSLFCPLCMARRVDSSKICHKESPFILAPAVFYNEPAPQIIYHLKYKKLEKVANLISAIVIFYFANLRIDTENFSVTFIPLHFFKEASRGFNQSKIIAKNFAEYFNLPLINGLKRTRGSDPQAKSKNYKERYENVKNCFAVKNPTAVKGKDIILIDDISTSGSTLYEASRELKKCGAKKIIALVFAKAV